MSELLLDSTATLDARPPSFARAEGPYHRCMDLAANVFCQYETLF
jgi:hypothetical protein